MIKMEDIKTPEHFCWLYAVGCLEMRLHAGTLHEEDFGHAMWFVTHLQLPPPYLIRDWFPKPFTTTERRYGECTLEYMKRNWREDHKSSKETSPVYPARIKTIELVQDDTDSLLVIAYSLKRLPGGGRILTASNYHQWALDFNDEVNIHGNVVAEITKKVSI